MTRNYKSITLLLVALAVLSFSSALYMYNDYRILDQNYQAMQGNIDDSLTKHTFQLVLACIIQQNS